MRCLMVIDSLKVGGAEMLALGLTRAAREAGWSVDVGYFTPGPLRDDIEALGAKTSRLSRFGLRDPLAWVRAARLVARLRPDVLHTHLTKSDVVMQPIARAMGIPRRIVTLHNTDAWRRSRLLSGAYRAAIAGASDVVAVSQEVMDYTVRTGGAPQAAQRHVVENGVDVVRFRDAAPMDFQALDPDNGRRPGDGVSRGGECERCVVAVIGRMDPQKNHGRMVDAARIASEHFPGLRFVFAGDGALRTAISLRVKSVGMENRIIMPGVLRDIPGLLAACDIVAFSSDYEGLPMAMLEAMAAGRPVVATPVGAVPDVLRRSGAGLVAASMSAEDLAAALMALAGAPERRHVMGAAGRAEVESRYCEAAMVARVLALWHGEPSPGAGSGDNSTKERSA